MAGNHAKSREEEPIKGSVENVRISRGRVYQTDLESLMKGSPLVLKIGEGIYSIDFSASPRLL